MREQGQTWDTSEVVAPLSAPSEPPTVEGRVEEAALKPAKAGEDNSSITEEGFQRCFFLGFVSVGRVGTVEQIESGVVSVVRRGESQRRPVLLKLGEAQLTVYCAESKAVLLQHGYPEISSCGRRVDYPLNFSYIAGETTCTLAKKFTCFVFEARSDEQSRGVLKAIADGFDRTHWAV